MSLSRNHPGRWLLLVTWMVLSTAAAAASFEFLGVERVFGNPTLDSVIHSYAIVFASSRRQFNALSKDGWALPQEHLVYQTRVEVEGQVYYRLALGNFADVKPAQIELKRLQQTFADAWIYRRSPAEEKQLAKFIDQSGTPTVVAPAPKSVTAPVRITAGKAAAAALLERARQEFIDGNYARVIAITDKVAETGDLTEVREALELAGITRERQGKFSQAVNLYEALLDTQPGPATRARTENRLEGIRTMNLVPKTRIANNTVRSERNPWRSRGVLQQFYQDDRVDMPKDSLHSVNRVLVTDLDLSVQRRTDKDKLELRLDAGLVKDLLDDSTESRIYSASLEYERDDFRLTGGRQRRTLTGVYGSFDGLSIADLSHSGYQLGFAYGYLVQSSYDDFNSDQPFIGANLDLTPYPWLDLSFYVIHQEISGLTDRQSVGTEIRYQSERAFVYGFIDYDVFFNELNNLSLNSNYQLNDNWSLNLTLSQGFSATLSTLSALQGQPVTSMDELKDLLSNDEIYELARDRTSKSQNLFIASSYRFDAKRYLYVHLSALKLDAIEASGGIEKIPSSKDLQLAVDYSFQGLFSGRDYATVGGRIADSTSSEILSIRARTRFGYVRDISYDPRLQVDRRKSKRDGTKQLILKPSFKITYRSSDKLSIEGIFGIEYSNLDLPELKDQYIYSLYLGYYYYMF